MKSTSYIIGLLAQLQLAHHTVSLATQTTHAATMAGVSRSMVSLEDTVKVNHYVEPKPALDELVPFAACGPNLSFANPFWVETV